MLASRSGRYRVDDLILQADDRGGDLFDQLVAAGHLRAPFYLVDFSSTPFQ
jgi:hypothetical protein